MSDTQNVITEINALLTGGEVTQAQIARETGRSPAVVSNFLGGKYAGDNEGVLEELLDWLDRYHQKRKVRYSKFVVTPMVKTLWGIFDAVRTMQCINVIVGAPGVGKTLAAEQYQERKSNTWMATLCPAYSSVTECLLEVADAVGVSNPPASKGAITRKICKAITGTDGLIIIDEADHLGVDGFEQLRAIQDATKIGMVLIGNPDGLEKVISNTYSNKDLTRLRSRVARFKRIGKASIADVDAIAEAWGLGGKEELAVVQEITSQPGALRILSHTINQAWITAQGMGQGTLSAEHIKATYKSMYGNQKKQLKGV